MTPNSPESLKARFWPAIALYYLLALIAGIRLQGPIRLAVWVFLAGLALKTWIATYRPRS
jgi:hypothetical protein